MHTLCARSKRHFAHGKAPPPLWFHFPAGGQAGGSAIWCRAPGLPKLGMSAPFPFPLGSHDIDSLDVDFLFTSVLDFQILKLQNDLKVIPVASCDERESVLGRPLQVTATAHPLTWLHFGGGTPLPPSPWWVACGLCVGCVDISSRKQAWLLKGFHTFDVLPSVGFYFKTSSRGQTESFKDLKHQGQLVGFR